MKCQLAKPKLKVYSSASKVKAPVFQTGSFQLAVALFWGHGLSRRQPYQV